VNRLRKHDAKRREAIKAYQVAALQLERDLQTMRDIMQLMGRLDLASLSLDLEFAATMRKCTIAQVKSWERFAEILLRERYLKL
jgi:hypothetical protein